VTDPGSAPLLSAWTRFVDGPGNPFTIPGHKQRAGTIWPELGRVLHGDVPLFGGIDTVKDAPAALLDAEELGAQLWHADWCRYSTGGSTHANQAVALAVGRPGDTVLITRSAHRSTLLGLIFAGLRPIWLPNDIDPRFGLPSGLSLPALATALADNPDAVGLFLVEPSYVGTVSDLPAVIGLAHEQGVPVIVDQAWGAHFGFHPAFPGHALGLGADAMIISAHKTLPAYSQGSVVAASTRLLDRGRLDRGFDASATTSPAGAILASIDAARALLAAPLGRERLGRLVATVDDARERLRSEPSLDGVRLPAPADFAAHRFDPAKLVVLLAGTSVSGNDIERELIAGGFPLEQADHDTLIPIVTMLDDSASVQALCDRLAAVAATLRRVQPRPSAVSPVWGAELPPAPLTPRDAFFAPHEQVPAERAAGRISAELIAPYPPGIPILVPGELITAQTLAALETAARSGVRIAYAADPALRSYQVVRQT
jgi:arginine decarboxylase